VILFLDFDGVLHPAYEAQAVPADVAFCHLPRFEAVLRDFPQVEIVISSLWRHQLPFDKLTARFSADIRRRIIGITPGLDDQAADYVPARREEEILGWLADNGRTGEPWIALDDAIWLFEKHRDRVVTCIHYRGFDDEAANALRARLRG
jgi:hypothetical protein